MRPEVLEALLKEHGFTQAQLRRGRCVIRKSDGVYGRIVRSNELCKDVVSVLWRPHTFKSDPWAENRDYINIADIQPVTTEGSRKLRPRAR
jgi:hypothetical protein